MQYHFKQVEVAGLGAWTWDPTRRPPSTIRSVIIEGSRSLLLVEVGLGAMDFASPIRRLGLGRAQWQKNATSQTMRQRLTEAGYRPDDVSDIFVSHLHTRHTGGLFDFPSARVHCLIDPRYHDEKTLRRLLPSPATLITPTSPARRMYGFDAYPFKFDELDLHLVALPGVAPGHAGLLMPIEGRQLLHIGACVQSLAELQRPRPFAAEAWTTMTCAKPFSRLETLRRLRSLLSQRNVDITLISSFGAIDAVASCQTKAIALPEL